MSSIEVLYFTDNEGGRALASRIVQMGVSVSLQSYNDIERIMKGDDTFSVMIFDFDSKHVTALLKDFSKYRSLENIIKLVITENSEIEGVYFNAVHLLNLEFIFRPVDERSFMLLLEKVLLVEKYRKLLKLISDESESRIDVLEYMLDMNSEDLFDEKGEREVFLKILDFERKLMQEHMKLNDSIRNIALNRNYEYVALKDRVQAEEMLNDLRREEMINANRIIEAQESLIEYSARELIEAKKILVAKDSVEELSRYEAMDLHRELDRLRTEKRELEERIAALTARSAE